MFKCPPLPFQGNKTHWRKTITEIINNIDGDCSDYVFVDLFGGSGIVSHWLKHLKPKSTVIYNDFDNYCDRLNKIDETNEQLSAIRDMIKDFKENEKLPKEISNKIMEYLRTLNEPDLLTLEANFLFAHGGASYTQSIDDLKYRSFYCKMRKTDINNNIDEYLKGLIITHKDWKELYEETKEKYKDKEIVYIMDPPYLYADKSGYNDKYWKLADTVLLLKALYEMDKFMFFNGDKSGFYEFFEVVNNLASNPINYTIINKDANQPLNASKKRYEYMIISNNLYNLT